MRVVDLKFVKAQFDLRWATGESEKKKRIDSQRISFKRALDKAEGYATWIDGDIEWIWTTRNEGGTT